MRRNTISTFGRGLWALLPLAFLLFGCDAESPTAPTQTPVPPVTNNPPAQQHLEHHGHRRSRRILGRRRVAWSPTSRSPPGAPTTASWCRTAPPRCSTPPRARSPPPAAPASRWRSSSTTPAPPTPRSIATPAVRRHDHRAGPDRAELRQHQHPGLQRGGRAAADPRHLADLRSALGRHRGDHHRPADSRSRRGSASHVPNGQTLLLTDVQVEQQHADHRPHSGDRARRPARTRWRRCSSRTASTKPASRPAPTRSPRPSPTPATAAAAIRPP